MSGKILQNLNILSTLNEICVFTVYIKRMSLIYWTFGFVIVDVHLQSVSGR